MLSDVYVWCAFVCMLCRVGEVWYVGLLSWKPKGHLSADHNYTASTSFPSPANILRDCVMRRELLKKDVYIRPRVTTHFSCKQTAGPFVWLLDHQRASLTDSLHHEKQTEQEREGTPPFVRFFLHRSSTLCRTQPWHTNAAAALLRSGCHQDRRMLMLMRL